MKLTVAFAPAAYRQGADGEVMHPRALRTLAHSVMSSVSRDPAYGLRCHWILLLIPLSALYEAANLPVYHSWGLAHGSFTAKQRSKNRTTRIDTCSRTTD